MADVRPEGRAPMKPLVYVAGPITGDPFGCVRQSMYAWESLRAAGCVPICPQWSVIAEMVEPQDYERWLEYDFDLIRRSDALLRLDGDSPGADREVDFARTIGVPVFFEAPNPSHEFAAFMKAWRAEYPEADA